MSQAPTPYTRQSNFITDAGSDPNYNWQSAATDVESEYEAIKSSLNQTIFRLGEIQRDDGLLRQGIVPVSAIGPDLATYIGLSSSNLRGNWTSGTLYELRDIVSQGTATYMCISRHTSSLSLSDDQNQGWWVTLQAPAPTSLTIPQNSVTANEIATGAVGELELAASAVTASKIFPGAVGAAALASGAVQNTNIATNAVRTVHIQAGAVTGEKLENVSGLATGSYGSSTNIPVINIDSKGRVTSASSTPFALDDIAGLTAQQYGSSTSIPVITVNSKGRITAISTQNIPSSETTRLSRAWCEFDGNIADMAAAQSTFALASGTTRTINVTRSAHGLSNGDFVTLHGLTDGTTAATKFAWLNGTWEVQSVQPNSFQFTVGGTVAVGTTNVAQILRPTKIVTKNNILKVGRVANGVFKVWFQTDAPSALYTVVATGGQPAGTFEAPAVSVTPVVLISGSHSVSGFTLAGTNAAIDKVSFVVFGP